MALSAMPSLNLLRGFEASGRLGSFSDAAEELGVTQGAISRQIKALEEYVGTPLFSRDERHPKLTERGRAYWETVSRCFRDLETSTETLMRGSNEKAVTVCVLPTFAMRWLIPRLTGFQAKYPGIDVRVLSSDAPAKASALQYDLAVVFGVEAPSAATVHFLTDEANVAVCHPALVQGLPQLYASDIPKHTILAASARPAALQHWLAAMGTHVEALPNVITFKHFYLTIQAALNQMGIALVPRFYVESELQSGQLVTPFGPEPSRHGSYYLIQSASAHSDAARCFQEWLRGQFA